MTNRIGENVQQATDGYAPEFKTTNGSGDKAKSMHDAAVSKAHGEHLKGGDGKKEDASYPDKDQDKE